MSQEFLDLLETSSSKQSSVSIQLVFRNYSPLDANLHQYKLTSPEIVSQVEALYKKKVKKQIAQQKEIQNEPVSAVAQKADSDIQERMKRKLEILKRRTELAALTIVKEEQS